MDKNVVIVCYSLTGHTLDMAGEVKRGIESEGLSCSIFNLKDDLPDKKAVEEASGIIAGTPVYLASAF